MTRHDFQVDALLDRAAGGDAAARQELLVLHQERLRQMVAVRMDRRLAARFDASDVVQEVLAEAHQKLSDYLHKRPLPFYPWLRQIAWERLLKLHQHHLRTQKRSAAREQPLAPALSDESVLALADRLFASGSSPSEHVVREELRRRVQDAAPHDRTSPDRGRQLHAPVVDPTRRDPGTAGSSGGALPPAMMLPVQGGAGGQMSGTLSACDSNVSACVDVSSSTRRGQAATRTVHWTLLVWQRLAKVVRAGGKAGRG